MLGKILVCSHLGLSLLFATWAMALYTTRVDWTNRKGTPPKPDGELVARMVEYERLTKTVLKPADIKWRTNRKNVEDHEAWRPIERPWFESELQFLRKGNTAKAPVKQIVREPNGTPKLVEKPAEKGGALIEMDRIKDRDGNAFTNRDGQELKLKSLDEYNDAYDKKVEEVTLALKTLQKWSKLDGEQTAGWEEEKDGVRTWHPGLKDTDGKKGIFTRIGNERLKQSQVKNEYEEVRPLLLKTAVELQNLVQLRQRLEQRLKELEPKSLGDDLK